jgi:ribonuclease HI
VCGLKTGEVHYNKTDSPRACVVTGDGVIAWFLPQFSDRNTCAVHVEGGGVGAHPLIVCSAYLGHELEEVPHAAVRRLIDHCEQHGIELIIGADANAHHTAWGSTDVNARGETLLDYIAGTNLDICNLGNRPTFLTRNRQEVLDVTLATVNTAGRIEKWMVDQEDFYPDHQLITWVVDDFKSKPKQFWRNPRKCDWSKYEDECSSALQRLGAPKLDTNDELQGHVTDLTAILVDGFERNCVRSLKGARKGKPKWPPELKNLQLLARRAQRRAVETNLEEDWDAKRHTLREFKKAQRNFDYENWKKFCTDTEEVTPTARLVKLLKGDARSQVGMLRRGDGTYTSSPEEAIDVLLSQHFPKARDSDTPHTLDYSPVCGATVDEIITNDRIKRAISSFKPYKAPGLDNVSPVMLQNAGQAVVPILKAVYTGSLKLGYIPTEWRNANVVFIPKPGKENYETPGSFRPISLTSFLLKAMEKVIDMYLSEGNCRVLHENQHAYRKGHSTETALHELISKVENAYHNGQYALSIFLDLSGAFNRASFTALKWAMERAEIAPLVRRWIGNMLVSQRAIASINNCKRETPVERGTPQGGAGSPRLWNLLVDEIITDLSTKYKAELIQAYADDIALVLTGCDPGVLRERAEGILNEIHMWTEEKGLSLNAKKTEAIMFTRRRKWSKRPLVFRGAQIPLRDQVKYLGVILDKNLTWRQHCQWKSKACANAIMACRRAIGPTWGLKPRVTRWIYTAIIRPTLSYAACIWVPALAKRTRVDELTKVQRLGCLMVTSAFRTTPTKALERILNLIPIEYHLKKMAINQMLRMKQEGRWKHRISPGQPNSHGSYLERLAGKNCQLKLPCDVTKTMATQKRNFRVVIHDRELSIKLANADSAERRNIRAFTDGSRTRLKTGLGYCIYMPNDTKKEVSLALGKLATVNQAELLAIEKCAEYIINERNLNGVPVTIFSDSQCSLRALDARDTRSRQVLQCVKTLNELGRNRATRLQWVPGHADVEGNEAADTLAKEGACMDFIGPEPVLPVPRGALVCYVDNWFRRAWDKNWAGRSDCRQARNSIRKDLSVYEDLLVLEKRELRQVVTMLTGHGNLAHHLQKMGVIEEPTCPKCGAPDEDAEHHIGCCPAYMHQRMAVFGTPRMYNQEWTMKIHKIVSFLRRTKRLTEITE